MLTKRESNFLHKKLIEGMKSPLYIHDNDPDGLCSYLLLYRAKGEGKGVILRTSSTLTVDFKQYFQNYLYDSIFILDIPNVDQEFIDQMKVPIYWIDHHQVQNRKKVKYYNPRIKNVEAYVPTTMMSYQVSQKEDDIWIAMVGCLADWYMPNFSKKFIEKYPDLMSKDADIRTALFKDEIGKLVRIFSFLLKGKSGDVRKNIKILTRIKSPYEILRQNTAQGKFLYKKFTKFESTYQEMLKLAMKKRTRGKLLIYEYAHTGQSFTTNLANEVTAHNPDKVIIINRKHNGKMKMSLRAVVGRNILNPLTRALEGIDGYGGGHFNACGGVIAENDWDRFIQNFKRELTIEDAGKKYPKQKSLK